MNHIGVILSSLVSMPPCSMARCPEGGEGETAFIDQRAVAAGKNLVENHCTQIKSYIE